jgi:hypothetical protein
VIDNSEIPKPIQIRLSKKSFLTSFPLDCYSVWVDFLNASPKEVSQSVSRGFYPFSPHFK